MTGIPAITANGVTMNMPPFTAFEATINPQQWTAERNGNGTLIRETLPDKWSLKIEWEFGTPEEFYAWCKYLSSLTRVDFGVHFPAPTGDWVTATMYVSPISARMLSFSRGKAGRWKTIACSFMEV